MNKNIHTKTYTSFRIKDVFHKRRLNYLKRLANTTFKPGQSYCDLGCSEGFVTKAIADEINAAKVFAFDHSEKHLKSGREKYDFEFARVDLNSPTKLGPYEAVSCFETLEHVGNLEVAVNNVVSAKTDTGACIISVPNEVGLIGIVKAIIKMFVYGYSIEQLDPALTRLKYLTGLLNPSARISRFRTRERSGYGTHFGFDYRDIADILKANGSDFKMLKSGTTVFFVIR